MNGVEEWVVLNLVNSLKLRMANIIVATIHINLPVNILKNYKQLIITIMNKSIDLTKILKDCPKGTKLYSTILGEVELYKIEEDEDYPIVIETITDQRFRLAQDGRHSSIFDGECTLFPSKNQRDWSKFVPPYKFKDGDIVATSSGLHIFILERVENGGKGYCYIGYDLEYNEFFRAGEWYFSRLATEEERRKFFDALKENGYKWNAKTKTLGKLIPNRFDPKTLKPFDKVLVRNCNVESWRSQIFSHILEGGVQYPYLCINNPYKYCIPYNNDTKHLVGTTEEAPEYYRYWED